jgi:transcriptional regulator with GAF, ATPase, and Fis domain
VRYTESNLRDFTEIVYTLSSVIQEKKNEIAQAQTALLLTEVNVIANAVGSTEHLKDLYAEIHESIKRLIPQDELSRNFYLVLLPKDTQPSDITPETLVSYVYYVDEKDTLPADAESEALGKGVTSFLLRKGELLHCDQKMSRELFEIGELEINGTDSLDWIGVPLKIGEKVIGGLAIQSYEE